MDASSPGASMYAACFAFSGGVLPLMDAGSYVQTFLSPGS